MNSIRKIRKEKGITQKELSEKTGINETLISRYETGTVTPPLPRLTTIAEALNVTTDQLLNTAHHSSHSNHKELYYTLIQKSNGRCDLCGADAPFFTEDARPYLELHHIIPKCKGGESTISNVVVLCPNCNRKINVLNNEHDVSKLKAVAESRSNEL